MSHSVAKWGSVCAMSNCASAAHNRRVADAVGCRNYSRKSIDRRDPCRSMVSRLVSLAISSSDPPPWDPKIITHGNVDNQLLICPLCVRHLRPPCCRAPQHQSVFLVLWYVFAVKEVYGMLRKECVSRICHPRSSQVRVKWYLV